MQLVAEIFRILLGPKSGKCVNEKNLQRENQSFSALDQSFSALGSEMCETCRKSTCRGALRTPLITGAVSFDSSLLFAEDGNEPAAGTTEDGKKKQKRDEKKDDNEKKKRMKIEQVERFTIKDVVANAPGTELISIGGLPISKITLDMLKAFCAKNKISIPMAERKKTAIPAVILSYIKAGPMKERITAGTRKKKGAATTKPACLVTDGTIYRTIITITCEKGKPLFIATRGSHDKNMLDTRKPHPFEWDGLNAIYGSDEPELDCIGDMQELLLGYDIDVDISSIYDKLNTTEFRLVCNYVLAFYRKAMNAKSLSGNHKPIDAYIEGKPWIAFLHARLQAIGDSALMDCAYAQLPDSVFRSSDQPTSSARGRNSRGPSATERTASRVSSYSHPNQATISARKYDLLEANERTTKSIHDKHAQEIEYATQDRFVSMKKSLFEASRDLASVRRKVRSMNWSTEDYESLKMEKKSLKGNVKYLQKQYDQLKKDVGYDSPSDSSDSESDEDPTSSLVLA